jgi:5,10-methylenetetrahydrofolate reductase
MARSGHPKVENLVQDIVFFKSRFCQMRVFFFSLFFFEIPQIYEYI